MDFLNKIQWFIGQSPKTAINKDTGKPLTNEELDMLIIEESISLSLPLNDNYLFFVQRQIIRPVTVRKLLKTIYNFYQEPLKPEYMDKAFEELEDWKEEVIENEEVILNYHVFTDTVDPDFCGLEFNEDTGEYVVLIGPE